MSAGICWYATYETHPVSPDPGRAVRISPEELCSDLHLLHAQVSGRRGLTWAACDRRHRQTTEEEVHGGQEGLQKTDRAESRASVGGKVDFIGVRAGWLEERFILTSRPGGKDTERVMRPVAVFRQSIFRCYCCFTLQLMMFFTFWNGHPRSRPGRLLDSLCKIHYALPPSVAAGFSPTSNRAIQGSN